MQTRDAAIAEPRRAVWDAQGPKAQVSPAASQAAYEPCVGFYPLQPIPRPGADFSIKDDEGGSGFIFKE